MPCPTEPLPMSEVLERMKQMPTGWRLNQNALERIYEGKNYRDALNCLNRVAGLAEESNHHPDLILSWKTLTIRYWTHNANGLTDLDFEQAQEAERLLIKSEQV